MKKVIVGWKATNTANVAKLYNVGDPAYAKKLDYALGILKQKKAVACAR